MIAAASARAAAFRDNVAGALAYWEERTRALKEADMRALDGERQNLFRAMQFGLKLPGLWPVQAAVALQVHPLIEQRGYWEEWIPILERLVESCPADNLASQVRLLNRLGQLHRHLSRLERATEVHQRAERVASGLSDRQILAEAQYNLSHDYVARREYEAAERYGQAALENLDGAVGEERAFIAETLQALAGVARARGDFQVAEGYLVEAVAIIRELGDMRRLSAALNRLALNQRQAGDQERAIAVYKEAVELLEGTHHELDWSSAMANLGAVYFDKGDFPEAEAAFRQADTPFLRRSSYTRQKAVLTVSMGNVLLKQERLAEAAGWLRQAIALWEKVGDELELANAVGSLGEVLAARGEIEAAIPLFEKAMALLDRFPNSFRARRLRKFFKGELKKAKNR